MFKALAITACTISTILWNVSQATEYRITEITHPLEINLEDINDNGIVVGYVSKKDYDFDPPHFSHRVFQWNEQHEFLIFGITTSTVKVAGINNNNTVAFKMGKNVYLWNSKDGYKNLAFGINPICINNQEKVLLKECGKIGELFFDDDTGEYESVSNFLPLSSFYNLCILSDDSNTMEIGPFEDVDPISMNDKNHILLMLQENYECKWEIRDSNSNTLMKLTKNPDYHCTDIRGIALNNHDDVVGYERYFDKSVGVLWTASGHKIELPPILQYTIPEDVNDSKQVVGYMCKDFRGDDDHQIVLKAFIFDEEHGLQDLNSCIPQYSDWVLSTANAINNRGQIIGTGFKNGIPTDFLLTPISN